MPKRIGLVAMSMVWRHSLLIILALLCGMFIGLALQALQDPVYRAEARIELATAERGNGATARLHYVAEGATSSAVLTRVSALAPAPRWTLRQTIAPFLQFVGIAQAVEPQQHSLATGAPGPVALLRQGLDVRANVKAGTVSIAYEDARPAHAAHIANQVALALIAYFEADPQRRRLDAMLALLQADYAARLPIMASDHQDMRVLRIRIADVERDLARLDQQTLAPERRAVARQPDAWPKLRLLDPALVSAARPVERDVSPFLTAMSIALTLACLGVAWRETAPRPFRSPTEIEATLGLPVLGLIPDAPVDRLRQDLADSRSAVAKASRALTAELMERDLRVILVTSAGPAEGRTTTACELAELAAARGRRVLLIDASLHAPALHLRYALCNARGLTSLLTGKVIRAAVPHIFQEVRPRLRVLTAGQVGDGAAGLLSSKNMASFLSAVSRKFDLVVIDGPPVLNREDVLGFAGMAGDTLLVTASSAMTREQVGFAVKQLRHGGAKMLGVALTRFRAADLDLHDPHRSEVALREAAIEIDRKRAAEDHERSLQRDRPAYDWRPRRSVRARLTASAAALLSRAFRRGQTAGA